MKVREVRDAKEYLNQVYPNEIVKLLDEVDLTISSNEEQIREAEKDILLRFLEEDGVLLFDVAKALNNIMLDIKLDLDDHADDSAWDYVNEGISPNSSTPIKWLGRSMSDIERAYWDTCYCSYVSLYKESD
jgi:hypothetical protein